MIPVEIKIADIGGGSRYWARDLLPKLALTPRLKGRVDLYDINHAAALRIVAVAGRSPWTPAKPDSEDRAPGIPIGDSGGRRSARGTRRLQARSNVPFRRKCDRGGTICTQGPRDREGEARAMVTA